MQFWFCFVKREFVRLLQLGIVYYVLYVRIYLFYKFFIYFHFTFNSLTLPQQLLGTFAFNILN